MGWELGRYENLPRTLHKDIGSGEIRMHLADCKYHEEWNQLMPVVSKIETLGYDSRIEGNNSDGGFLCDFVDIENKQMACETSYKSKIDAVYSAVVEFIKVYNDENNQMA